VDSLLFLDDGFEVGMNHSDYWEETVREAASEAGVELTSDQVGIIAGAVEARHHRKIQDCVWTQREIRRWRGKIGVLT
jgi:hypothetical protein